MAELTFKLTAGTDIGLNRSNNEDNFIVNPDLQDSNWFIPDNEDQTITLGPYGALMVVADGMGGMNAGEVASAIAIDSIKEHFCTERIQSAVGNRSRMLALMSEAVRTADKNIKRKAKEDNKTSGMGTTVVMAWVYDADVYVCWCGDSRAYLYRPSSGLTRLSKDHSYVQELVDAGKLDSELAFDHPNSNIITRSLGDSSVPAKPDTASYHLSEGDIVLLCTDGLCGLCRDEQINDVVARNCGSIDQCRKQLIDAALANGGYDNVTVSLLKVSTVSGEQSLSSTHSDIRNNNVKSIFNFIRKHILQSD